MHYFPINAAFTREQILERWNAVLTETLSPEKFKEQEYTNAVRYLNVHFKCKRIIRKKQYQIVSENPYGLDITGRKPGIDENFPRS